MQPHVDLKIDPDTAAPTEPLRVASRDQVAYRAQVVTSRCSWEPQLSPQHTIAVSCFADSWMHLYILRDGFSGTHLDSLAFKTQEWTGKNLNRFDPGGPRAIQEDLEWTIGQHRGTGEERIHTHTHGVG